MLAVLSTNGALWQVITTVTLVLALLLLASGAVERSGGPGWTRTLRDSMPAFRVCNPLRFESGWFREGSPVQ